MDRAWSPAVRILSWAAAFVWIGPMSHFETRLGYDFDVRSKDRRKSPRRQQNSDGWIRLGEGFAVRPCKLVDVSDTGLRISMDRVDRFMTTFVFMASRDDPTGRRARVRWRRGAQIGAEFIQQSAPK